MKVARMAVGGLVLAEVTGGFAAIPAYAAEPPALARTVEGHSLERHHHHHHHHKHVPIRHKAAVKKPAVKPVVRTVVETVVETSPSMYSHYVVQPGDTLTHIAAEYQVPWETLWSVNTDRLDHPDFLPVGQEIRLPA